MQNFRLKLESKGLRMSNYSDDKKLAIQIGAARYFEVSALTQKGIFQALQVKIRTRLSHLRIKTETLR